MPFSALNLPVSRREVFSLPATDDSRKSMLSTSRPKPAEFHVFDTTLRDGSQQEGLNLSVADKLAIAALIDELGVDFIEGGWPGANPNDTAFFAAMADGAQALKHAELV